MKQFLDKGLNHTKKEEVFDMVLEEDKRQLLKWSWQNRTLFEWLCYLTEEVGELSQAISEEHYRNGNKEEIIKEAIQVATLSLKIAKMVKQKQEEEQIQNEETK